MFSLVSKFSLMFWMYRMLFYTPVLLFVVSESTALVFSILKEHRPSSLFCDSSALVFPTCYFNLTKADLFYFRDGMSSWHFQFCLKLGASFVIQLLLDFFFFLLLFFFKVIYYTNSMYSVIMFVWRRRSLRPIKAKNMLWKRRDFFASEIL